jgi:hypothetical protein
MKDIISKELLSEVLEEAVISIEAIGINGIHICSNRGLLHTEYTLNIHELAHKCKEWAIEKGYEIVETAFMIRIRRVGQDKQKIWEYPREMQDAGIYFSPSFTFKACQWIYDNKDLK